MGRDDDDHKLLDQMSARSGASPVFSLPLSPLQVGGSAAAARSLAPRRAVDRLSAKDRLWYMSSAICCTLLPLHLYINVLDLELASSQLILAVGCCGASVIGLFRFYHEAAKMKKHACAPPLLPRPAPPPRSPAAPADRPRGAGCTTKCGSRRGRSRARLTCRRTTAPST